MNINMLSCALIYKTFFLPVYYRVVAILFFFFWLFLLINSVLGEGRRKVALNK